MPNFLFFRESHQKKLTKRIVSKSGLIILIGAVAMTTAACTSPVSNNIKSDTKESKPVEQTRSVTLVAYDSFPLSEETQAEFKKQSGYDLKVVKSGDGVELANKIILTKNAPLGDAVFGLDNNTAAGVVDAGAIDEFSENLETSVQALREPGSPLVPVDKGEVCINYDYKYFQDNSQEPPASFDDLINPRLRGLTVVEDPRTSTPGLAFMLATINAKGESGWKDYWKSLKENKVKVASSWDDAFNADFTAGGNENNTASYPIMVSYSSSPAWSATEDSSHSPIVNVPATCYNQIEYAGVLKGAKNPQGGAALVKFLTEQTAQTDLVENNYMYPVLDTVKLPGVLASFGPPSGQAKSLDSKLVSQNREAWVRIWAEIMG